MSIVPFADPSSFFSQCPALSHCPALRPLQSLHSLTRAISHLDAGSKVSVDKNKYQMVVDVHQFTPEEIIVKTVGDMVIIEGKHEEKQDDHGYVSRHFVRKYHLPEDHKAEDVVSNLSSDGVLTVVAPRFRPQVEGERHVPIQATGAAHKAVRHHPAHH